MVAALSVGGFPASSSDAPPSAEELAPNVVALVVEVPAAKGTITLEEFRHGLELTAVQHGRRRVPGPDDAEYAKLERETVDSLLEAAWLRGQAVEWEIVVSRRQVKRTVRAIKRESFKNGAEFRAFLKEAHYTRRDVYDRVELQILGTLLQAHLRQQIGEHATKREEQRAFMEFIREFGDRWRSRTVCAAGYVTERCSNGPPPPR